MKVVKSVDVPPLNVGVGDTLTVSYQGEPVVSHAAEQALLVNRVLIVELEEGELGMKGGLGAILGEKV